MYGVRMQMMLICLVTGFVLGFPFVGLWGALGGGIVLAAVVEVMLGTLSSDSAGNDRISTAFVAVRTIVTLGSVLVFLTFAVSTAVVLHKVGLPGVGQAVLGMLATSVGMVAYMAISWSMIWNRWREGRQHRAAQLMGVCTPLI